MKPPKGLKGTREAKRLAKNGQPIAAASHLWRVNQPALGLFEAREIVFNQWGYHPVHVGR